MIPKRRTILMSMASGVVWTLAVLWIGWQVTIPVGMIMPVLMAAFFCPGLVLIALIGRLAQRRFFSDEIIDGQPFPQGSGAEIDQRVLTNTVEQLLLAICTWPLVGFVLGAGTVLALGISLTIARLMFWIGYHLSPPLRGLGFAASFYPSVGAALLTVIVALS